MNPPAMQTRQNLTQSGCLLPAGITKEEQYAELLQQSEAKVQHICCVQLARICACVNTAGSGLLDEVLVLLGSAHP